MSRQDKATTERHTKILRELVKRPENKVCADCKHNDPRWASWNIGVFLCIRCSGFHRGMGTHISRVKSVDLDVWTPEQMESILKWGNRRANLYWEAHLKPGHVPPDHKMESFIRSKYESRRWALDGPPPSDPSVLETEGGVITEQVAKPAPESPRSTILSPPRVSTPSLSPAVHTARQPQTHRLLSSAMADRGHQTAASVSQPLVSQPAQPAQALNNDLFSLDFHAPAATTQTVTAKRDPKQDILSLFSTPAVAPQQPAIAQSIWSQPTNAAPTNTAPAQPQTSMVGSDGIGAWGVSSGWKPPAAPAVQPNNIWSQPAPPIQASTSLNSNPWASPGAQWTVPAALDAGNGVSNVASTETAARKDDAFSDIWGAFK